MTATQPREALAAARDLASALARRAAAHDEAGVFPRACWG